MRPPAHLIMTEDGLRLPFAYRWIRAHGITALRPWYFIEDPSSAGRLREEFLREVTPEARVQDILPFAKRQDQDDVAAFVVEEGRVTESVCVVHLTWLGKTERPGWPSVASYKDIWDWLKRAWLEDGREWAESATEEDLLDLVEEG